MKRLSLGTISALFLAGAVAPAAFADTHGTLQSQTPSQNQTPGQMQTPNQAPERVPGQNPEAYPNETPGNQAPRSGQMQTPGMDRTPGQAPNQAPARVPGQNPEAYPNQTPGNQVPRQAPSSGQMRTPGQSAAPSAELNSMGMGANLSSDTVSPFQLAYMAVRGELDEGSDAGVSAYEARHGNAEGRSIVESAINQGYISSSLMDDQGYIDSVNQILRMQSETWRS
ncbi:hypothetical protein [Phormidium tenue]|uniref:DUF4168 domain-containing protein n=1 Tax=Phormidium tenue NIES-30 TaxID=549789 RepID=A0A1U7J6D3_9CYAN|nr:hypothetical protein [Phormidium tenue]MBD2231908.1 hypothetical protein [Phormidium tenue FACHB-1052]OKH48482.1 hypothetical protein NIES30_10755 [Phormidium tenue NIES-30]